MLDKRRNKKLTKRVPVDQQVIALLKDEIKGEKGDAQKNGSPGTTA